MVNVTAAAAQPIASWRPPLNNKPRPVNSETPAPTANSAMPLSSTDATKFSHTEPKKNGMTGIIAPAANDRNELIATRYGEPSSSGLRPSSSRASVSQRDAAVGDDARRERLRLRAAQPLGAIDQRQLAPLLLRVGLQLFLLQRDLPLEQLALRHHRDELARAHRERAREQTRRRPRG